MKPEDRKIIFQNLVNGIAPERLCVIFKCSEKEITDLFFFCIRKIKSYAFVRRLPAILVDTVAQAQNVRNRGMLIDILDKVDLDKAPLIKKVTNEFVNSNNMKVT